MGADLRTRTSEVRYAHAPGHSLAYRVISDGEAGDGHDVLLVSSGTASMEALFEDAVGQRLLDGLAGLGRLVVFDRSGIGLSDPPGDWDVPAFTGWLDDVALVVAAAGLERPVVVSSVSAAMVALAWVARDPEAVGGLVLLEPSLPDRYGPDALRAQLAGEVDAIALVCPSRSDEPGFREWFTRAGQSGASPRMAARAFPEPADGDLRAIEAAFAEPAVPVLLLRRPASPHSPPPADDPVLGLVPGAERVEIPGEDLMVYGGEVDALLAEVSRFVTGEARLPEAERVLAAVLFSDLVGSTALAAELGDAGWKRLLDRHDGATRGCVAQRGGTVVKTTGDGVLALFPSATAAVRAARELHSRLGAEGLSVRVGVHVGDVDRRGDDVSGMAVNVAARVMSLAEPGEVLVSDPVPPALVGSGVDFDERGEHVLKGVPGRWRLWSVRE